jgi:hypothetical protein
MGLHCLYSSHARVMKDTCDECSKARISCLTYSNFCEWYDVDYDTEFAHIFLGVMVCIVIYFGIA